MAAGGSPRNEPQEWAEMEMGQQREIQEGMVLQASPGRFWSSWFRGVKHGIGHGKPWGRKIEVLLYDSHDALTKLLKAVHILKEYSVKGPSSRKSAFSLLPSHFYTDS